MERYWTLIGAALLGLAGPGCIHIHLDGEAKEKVSAEILPASATQSKARTDSAVKPATALIPGGVASVPKMLTKPGSAKNQAVEMSAAWQNRVAYLPDPTRDGAMGAGLVGQLFLFGSNMQIATPEGPLTVELYDETPRAGRPPESVKLGRWTIDKDTLKKFRLQDERWGPCYALFLPWPDYRADIVRIRLTVKYEPEGGYPIYATPSTITIDTSAPGGNSSQPIVNTVVPGMQGGFGPMSAPQMSPIGGPPPTNYGQPNGVPIQSNGPSPGGMSAFGPPPAATPPAPLPQVGSPQPYTTYVIPSVAPQPMQPLPPATPMAPLSPMGARSPVSTNTPAGPLPIPTPMNGNGIGANGVPVGLPPIAMTAGTPR